jgi:hypothetical protein
MRRITMANCKTSPILTITKIVWYWTQGLTEWNRKLGNSYTQQEQLFSDLPKKKMISWASLK